MTAKALSDLLARGTGREAAVEVQEPSADESESDLDEAVTSSPCVDEDDDDDDDQLFAGITITTTNIITANSSSGGGGGGVGMRPTPGSGTKEPRAERTSQIIHSGHFMVSAPHRDASTRRRYDFDTVDRQTCRTYRFGPRSASHYLAIDASLTRLFECMTLAYSARLVSPKWKNFKGLKLLWRDKIRLNNAIWRAWHIQYVERRDNPVCHFVTPLDGHDALVHLKPEANILEGKYWKRRIEIVIKEYHNWRIYFKKRVSKCAQSSDQQDESAWTLHLDTMIMDFSDTLFSSLAQHSFAWPNPREIAHASNADVIQPGLIQLQPSLEDYMDTMDSLQGINTQKASLSPFPIYFANRDQCQESVACIASVGHVTPSGLEKPGCFSQHQYPQQQHHQQQQHQHQQHQQQQQHQQKLTVSQETRKRSFPMLPEIDAVGRLQTPQANLPLPTQVPPTSLPLQPPAPQENRKRSLPSSSIPELFCDYGQKGASVDVGQHASSKRSLPSSPTRDVPYDYVLTGLSCSQNSGAGGCNPFQSSLATQPAPSLADKQQELPPQPQPHAFAYAPSATAFARQQPEVRKCSVPGSPDGHEFPRREFSAATAAAIAVAVGGAQRLVAPVDSRRVTHISAEQKRRFNIKIGFDTLYNLVSPLNLQPNSKVSKAATLQKTVEYITKLQQERQQMLDEAQKLRDEIEELNAEINVCQQQLPATGVPITKQRFNQMRQMFDSYVRARTQCNWKFWIFSILMRPLFESYNGMVSTASMEELCRTVMCWLDQHCALPSLRPIVLTALRHLSTSTSILSDPSLVPEQVAQAAKPQQGQTHAGHANPTPASMSHTHSNLSYSGHQGQNHAGHANPTPASHSGHGHSGHQLRTRTCHANQTPASVTHGHSNLARSGHQGQTHTGHANPTPAPMSHAHTGHVSVSHDHSTQTHRGRTPADHVYPGHAPAGHAPAAHAPTGQAS
ncbi:unnamed protein product [Lampetra planeri]